MKKLLCMISHAPYRDAHALELLDVALVSAVFDCEVSVLFRGEGVWTLLKDQDATPLAQRTVGKVLDALETYDVNAVYVCAESLAARGLENGDLAISAEAVDHVAQAALIADQQAVLGAQT